MSLSPVAPSTTPSPPPPGVPATTGGGGAGRLRRARHVLAGGAAPERLPQRIRQAIEAREAAGEIIVGWVQAGAILLFGTLYALGPKAFPPDVPFAPVPWTLGIYAAVTAARLILAHRGRLSRGFVALSVVVDMTVLMVMIWSFHLQYAAPPALYLKAPTLMYVFILIALRALRFEARYVLLAGFSAALGWTVLVLYAAFSKERGEPMFTHNFAAYVMSYDILPGAEIDKIVSILVVTAILALAIVRARALLVQSVAEAAVARDLSRFVAPEVATRIAAAEQRVRPGQGERCEAAILFVDLRGFTALSRTLPPDDLIALLAEYQSLVVPVIREQGGCIDKFLGDGVLASFGAAQPSAGPAADALRAVDGIAAAAAAWRAAREADGLPAPRLGAAVAAGPVVFGAVGVEARLEYTVIGDAVNLAAKLEKHTKRECVAALTTRETYEAACRQGYRSVRDGQCEIRRARRVDGVEEPLDIAVLALT
jgi:adenylate cyclase